MLSYGILINKLPFSNGNLESVIVLTLYIMAILDKILHIGTQKTIQKNPGTDVLGLAISYLTNVTDPSNSEQKTHSFLKIEIQ